MTTWFEKEVDETERRRLVHLFDQLCTTNPDGRTLMLVSVEVAHADTTRLIACVPDKMQSVLPNGFTRLERSQLPKKATLLAGQYPEFETMFESSAQI